MIHIRVIIKKFIQYVLPLFALMVPVYPALAQGIGGGKLWDTIRGVIGGIGEGAFGYPGGVPPDARLIAAMVIRIIAMVLVFVFFLLVIYGGYKYMMVQGDEDEVRKGKGIIRTGVVGIGIVFASLSISKFVIGNIYCATVDSTDWCNFFMQLM